MVEILELKVRCSECDTLNGVRCFDFFVEKGGRGSSHPMASGKCDREDCHNWISVEETREAAQRKLDNNE